MTRIESQMRSERRYAILASIALGLFLIAILTLIICSAYRPDLKSSEDVDALELTPAVYATLDVDKTTNIVTIIATTHRGSLASVACCQVKDKNGNAIKANEFEGTLIKVWNKSEQIKGRTIDFVLIQETQTNTFYEACIGQRDSGYVSVDITPVDIETYTVEYENE